MRRLAFRNRAPRSAVGSDGGELPAAIEALIPLRFHEEIHTVVDADVLDDQANLYFRK